jgi:hypothetical protein
MQTDAETKPGCLCCSANEYLNCAEDGHIQTYQFMWMVDYVFDAPEGFTPYKTTIDIDLCSLHHDEILTNNNGDYPLLWGSNEKEALNMLLYGYLTIDGSFHKNKTCIQKKTCIHDYHTKCSAYIIRYNFLWRFRDRGKYGRSSYFTVLPLYLCKNHYTEILESNNQKQPVAFGWDYWDAIDSITKNVSIKIGEIITSSA